MYNQQPGADAFGSMPGLGGLQQQRGFAGFPHEMLGAPGAFGAPPPPLPQHQQPRGGLGLAGYGGLPQQPPRGNPFGGGFPPPQQPQQRGFEAFPGAGIPPPFQQHQQPQPRPNFAGHGFGGVGAQQPQQQQHRGGGFGGGQFSSGGFGAGAGAHQQSGDGRQQQGKGKSGGSFGGKGRGGGSFGDRGDPIRNFQSPGFGMSDGGKGGGGKGKRKGKDQSADSGRPDFGSSRPTYSPANPPPISNPNGTAAWSYGQTAKGGGASPEPKGAKGQKGAMGGKGMSTMSYGKGGDMGTEAHSNVFVGNLQEGTTQSSLEAACSPFGAISSCFVASKEGRAYGFVKYATVGAASRAIAGLNGQNGWVVKTANKDMTSFSGKGGSAPPAAASGKPTHTNVFVGNLNEGISEAQLEKVFKAYGQVDSCVVMNKTTDKTYGFVEFSTIKEAEASISGLNGQSGLLVKFANNDNQPMSWEDALPHSNLFVGSLPKGMTDRQLRDACEQHGSVQSCTIRSDADAEKAYGFVKFDTVAGAKRAIRALDGKDGWSVKCANNDVVGAKGEGGKGMFGMMPPPWMMGKGDWGKGDWGKGGWNDFGFGKGGKGMKGGSGWVWTSNSESDRPEPEPHDNLYVKNLPPGIKEDEVIKTFSQAGEVVECRVLSWDGVSECAALVRMSNVEQATKAKELIHGKVHENCHQKLSVALQQKGGESVPDHVFVKGLHCTTTQDQLQKAFSVVGEVKWTKILPLPFAPNPTKLPECCGLVQFSKAEEAEAAIEKFNNEVCPDVGLTTIVRYAEVQSTEKPEQKPNSNLYVKGWPVGFPDFLLQSVFQQYGQVVRLRLLENPDPEQPTCAALVQMSREDEAAAALKALHGQTVSPQVPSMHVKHAGKDQSPSGNLYVTSLPRTITEEEIRETFKKFGEVKRLRLLNQEKSPELRALVELESTEIAAQAVRELDNTVPVFKGPVLYIQYASKSPAGRKGE